MDTDSFIIYVQTDFYKDFADDVNEWFDTSGFSKDDDRLLPGISKKVLGKFKDELSGKNMTEFCGSRAKTYVYRWYEGKEKVKAKGIKKCLIKKNVTFENYKKSVLINKTTTRSQLRFKSDHHKCLKKK